jgi:intein/homing endonuclease
MTFALLKVNYAVSQQKQPVIYMKFDLSKIQPSRRDLKEGIKIPTALSVDLAEFLGIMVGDGHTGIYRCEKNNRSYYILEISGHMNDKKYHMNYISALAFKLFNTHFHAHVRPEHNIIILRKQSRAICQFLVHVIGIPHNKHSVGIPECILQGDSKIKSAFLRGLADSDFCVTIRRKPNVYPRIHGTSKSRILIEQCSKILDEFGIANSWNKEQEFYEKRDKTYIKYRVYVNGFARVNLFMAKIGFQNENKIRKYETLIAET